MKVVPAPPAASFHPNLSRPAVHGANTSAANDGEHVRPLAFSLSLSLSVVKTRAGLPRRVQPEVIERSNSACMANREMLTRVPYLLFLPASFFHPRLCLIWLTVSSALRLCQSADIDRFRRIENLSEAQSIPLHLSRFDTAFAKVALKSRSVFRSAIFPGSCRLTIGPVARSGPFDGDADAAVINGMEARATMILARVSGSAFSGCRGAARQRLPLLNFAAASDRGWPYEDGAQLIRLASGAVPCASSYP